MKYVFIALALVLIGSVADVPIMFLAVRGALPLLFVVLAGFLADILPDFFWYWLGGKIGIERFERLPFLKQKPERMEALEHSLEKHGAYILFCSKFVYLFGIPAQITAGAHHYPLKKAFIANSLGSLGWLLILFVLAHIFTSVDIIESHLHSAELSFTIFAAVAVLIYALLSKVLKRFID